jgi:hypothetical protein
MCRKSGGPLLDHPPHNGFDSGDLGVEDCLFGAEHLHPLGKSGPATLCVSVTTHLAPADTRKHPSVRSGVTGMGYLGGGGASGV